MIKYNFLLQGEKAKVVDLVTLQYMEDKAWRAQRGFVSMIDQVGMLASARFDVSESKSIEVSGVQDIFFFDAQYHFIYAIPLENQTTEIKIQGNEQGNIKYAEINLLRANKMYAYIKGDIRVQMFPIYNKDVALTYSQDNEEKYFRKKFEGKLTFVGKDYDIIMSRPFGNTIDINLEKETSNTKDIIASLQFVRTDCEIDQDNKTIVVQPDVIDDYTDILSGIENEYNVLELPLEVAPTHIDKRPCVQIYVAGSSVITNYLGSIWWEQDAKVTDSESELIDTYHFTEGNILMEINLQTDSLTQYSGVYGGNLTRGSISGEFSGTLRCDNVQGFYIYVERKRLRRDYGQGYEYYWKETAKIIRESDLATLSKSENETRYWYQEFTLYNFIPQMSGVPRADGKVWKYHTFVRQLLDVESSQVAVIYEMPTDDIAENNRNYHYIGSYTRNIAKISSRYSDTPTEWGIADNGKYFLPPTSMSGVMIPIARSSWHQGSLWHWVDGQVETFYEIEGRKQYTLNDVYPLSSVISNLLKQFAPNITHEGTEEYSQFLYGNNKPIGDRQFELLITPKSNLIISNYTDPAQRANLTLSSIMQMLRKAFDCYWFIENNKLRIEHINYFKNGGSYTKITAIGTDLLTMRNLRNGKDWAYNTSKYTFEREQMPERYEYEWGDTCTKPFNGEAIQVNSNLVQKGNVEKINIANFMSDVDYCLLNPSGVSMDGFVLMAGIFLQQDNGVKHYMLPYLNIDNETIIQNGLVSMRFLQPQFLTYDMPASTIIVNNEPTRAKGIKRTKKQTLNIPYYDKEPETNKLVRTRLGMGEIESVSLNLMSRTAKTTLKYDPE